MPAPPDEIAALGPWFHNLHLPDGTQTLPEHPLIWGDFPRDKWRLVRDALPTDLAGWSALDIGCNAGFYAFELARRGARVVGLDQEPLYLNQARWAAPRMGLADRVEFREGSVYELARGGEETFDLVWFTGVFYHLRYPTLGLDIAARKTRRLLVFQTLTMPGADVAETPSDMGLLDRGAMLEPGWPKLAFIEKRLAGDETNWWTPNLAGVEAMLRAAGMRVVHRLPHEIFVCEPDPANPSALETWGRAEFDAATGRRQ